MNNRFRRQTGFAIVESLVALAVTVLGVLGITGMEMFLARSEDVAAQRTVATRIAQECIESMRSFTSTQTGIWAATPVANCPGTFPMTIGNATYSRTVTIDNTTQPTLLAATVTVAWTDRANTAQSVVLPAVISRTDPTDAGSLAFPLPQNTILKRPQDRNLNIPVPAIGLDSLPDGTGRSAFLLQSGALGYAVIFDNISGDILRICRPVGLTDNSTSAQILAALASLGLSTCTLQPGYIVTGYIGRDSSVSTTVWSGLSLLMGMNVALLTPQLGITCKFGDFVTDYKYYACMVPVAAAGNGWSGKMRLGGLQLDFLHNLSVCRYQYAPATGLDANDQNIQDSVNGYQNVTHSIDRQNYLLVSSATATCPASMTVTGISTGVLHQDCRNLVVDPTRATNCPAKSL